MSCPARFANQPFGQMHIDQKTSVTQTVSRPRDEIHVVWAGLHMHACLRGSFLVSMYMVVCNL